jgi:hypothetical protein
VDGRGAVPMAKGSLKGRGLITPAMGSRNAAAWEGYRWENSVADSFGERERCLLLPNASY